MSFNSNLFDDYRADDGCSRGFGGMDECADGDGGEECLLLCDFDIEPDGSIKSRGGYKPIESLPATPRAVWQGELDGESAFVFLIGNCVYMKNGETGELYLIGEVGCDGSGGEGGSIFWLEDVLYVLDGEDMYYFDENDTLSKVDGYVPLYGRDWDPELGGEIYEDINYLSDRIMISYKTTVENVSLIFGVRVASIDRAELDGEAVEVEELGLELSSDGLSARCNELASGKSLVLWLTLSATAGKRNLLVNCTKAFSCVGGSGRRLCLYGGATRGALYFSSPISPYSTAEAEKAYGETGELYFPHGGRFNISDSRHRVMTVSPHFGRFILFTDKDARCLDWNGKEGDGGVLTPEILSLSSSIGSDEEAVALCGNDPVSWYGGALWRWHSASGVRDECSATHMSDPIRSLLPSDGQRVVMSYSRVRDEIWLACPDDEEGRVLIYSERTGAWRCYTGIYPDSFFLLGSSMGFIRGATLYIFDDDRCTDSDLDGEYTIKPRLVSHKKSFGLPTREKKRIKYALDAEGSGCGVSISFVGRCGETYTVEHVTDGRKVFSERLGIGRFNSASYTLESDGVSAVRIYGLSIAAK